MPNAIFLISLIFFTGCVAIKLNNKDTDPEQ